MKPNATPSSRKSVKAFTILLACAVLANGSRHALAGGPVASVNAGGAASSPVTPAAVASMATSITNFFTAPVPDLPQLQGMVQGINQMVRSYPDGAAVRKGLHPISRALNDSAASVLGEVNFRIGGDINNGLALPLEKMEILNKLFLPWLDGYEQQRIKQMAQWHREQLDDAGRARLERKMQGMRAALAQNTFVRFIEDEQPGVDSQPQARSDELYQADRYLHELRFAIGWGNKQSLLQSLRELALKHPSEYLCGDLIPQTVASIIKNLDAGEIPEHLYLLGTLATPTPVYHPSSYVQQSVIETILSLIKSTKKQDIAIPGLGIVKEIASSDTTGETRRKAYQSLVAAEARWGKDSLIDKRIADRFNWAIKEIEQMGDVTAAEASKAPPVPAAKKQSYTLTPSEMRLGQLIPLAMGFFGALLGDRIATGAIGMALGLIIVVVLIKIGALGQPSQD